MSLDLENMKILNSSNFGGVKIHFVHFDLSFFISGGALLSLAHVALPGKARKILQLLDRSTWQLPISEKCECKCMTSQ